MYRMMIMIVIDKHRKRIYTVQRKIRDTASKKNIRKEKSRVYHQQRKNIYRGKFRGLASNKVTYRVKLSVQHQLKDIQRKSRIQHQKGIYSVQPAVQGPAWKRKFTEENLGSTIEKENKQRKI